MAKKPLQSDVYIQHLYVYFNEAEQFALFSGLSFAHFLDAMKMPAHLLLLNHSYEDASFNMHTQLEFVAQEEYPLFRKWQLQKKAQLSWIDFRSEKQVNTLTPLEQAELLYIGHKKEALRPPFYSTLQNEFVYLSTEEQQMTKIYFRHPERLHELIGNYFTMLARREATGLNIWRRKAKELIPDIPEMLLRSLKTDYQDGILISLADPEKTKKTIELHVRAVGEVSFADEFWSEIEESTILQVTKKITYDKKTDQWAATGV